MAITLPSAISTAIAGNDIWSCFLLEMVIGNTTYRITDHYRPLTFSSNTYQANGNLLSIANVSDKLNADNDNLSVNLSGIDSTFRRDVLNEDAIGGDVSIYRGFLSTTTGALLANPTLVYEGIVWAVTALDDHPETSGSSRDDRATFTVEADIRSVRYRLQANAGRLTNNTSNRDMITNIANDGTITRNTGDMAFEDVSALANRNLLFGAPA